MNIQQRKALEKVVQTTIQNKRNKLWSIKTTASEKEEKEVEKKNKAKAEVVNKRIKELRKELQTKGDELKSLSYQLGGYNDDELRVNLSSAIDDKLDKEHRAREEQLDDIDTKLTAKVWGIEGDFNDLLKELEMELKSI